MSGEWPLPFFPACSTFVTVTVTAPVLPAVWSFKQTARGFPTGNIEAKKYNILEIVCLYSNFPIFLPSLISTWADLTKEH